MLISDSMIYRTFLYKIPFLFFSSGIVSFAGEPKLRLDIEVDSIKSENIADYLGANVGYYKILDHFTNLYQEKYGKDVKKFILEELPAVIDGQLGSLFHGIIQTGYGYAAGCDQVKFTLTFYFLNSSDIVYTCSRCQPNPRQIE